MSILTASQQDVVRRAASDKMNAARAIFKMEERAANAAFDAAVAQMKADGLRGAEKNKAQAAAALVQKAAIDAAEDKYAASI